MIDTVLAFSGGLDSVYCLWDYLVKNPDKNILIHHVKLTYCNNARRQPKEYEAVKKTLSWLDKNGFKGRYKYFESTFNYGTIPTATYDIITTAYFTGVLLKKYKNIKYVISSTNLNEAGTTDLEQIQKKKKRADRLALIKLIACRSNIEMTYPIYLKNKQQLIKEIPKELFEVCWCCRKPNIKGEPCGKCFTCKTVNNAVAKNSFKDDMGGNECVWNT